MMRKNAVMAKGVYIAMVATVVTVCTSATAQALTFRANDHSDHTPNGCTAADCTLREAVIAANDHPGGDAIRLRADRGRYLLELATTDEDAAADGDLDITSGPLRISTSGDGRATIDAQRTDRIFDIGAARTRLSALKLIHGRASGDAGGDGGAIVAGDFGDGPVRIHDSILRNNEALGPDANGGAIDSDSSQLVRISDSVIKNNTAGGESGAVGGSIEGPVLIERSVLTGNTGAEGGGLLAVGPVTVVGSTIANNRAVSGQDGEQGDGAGIYVDDQGILQLTNVTVANNRAIRSGAGIYQEPGGITTANSVTVSGNVADSDGTGDGVAGGVFAFSSFELLNSIVAGNFAGATAYDCGGGGFTGTAPNLIGTAEGPCAPGTAVVADPQLEPLADNGGSTPTMDLAATSPAIGAASPATAPLVDQRGFNRDSAPDLGALESLR